MIPSVLHPGPTAPGFHSLSHCGPASFPGQLGPLVAQPVRRKPQKLSRRRAAASLPPGCPLLGPRRNAPGPCPDRRAASCDTVFTVTVDRQSLPDRRFTTTDCQFQEVACVLIHQRRLENLCFLHADVEPSPALAGRDGPGNGLGDHRGRPAPAPHVRRHRPPPSSTTQRPPRSRRPGPLHRPGRGPLAPGLRTRIAVSVKRSIPARGPADPSGLQVPVPSRNWLCFFQQKTEAAGRYSLCDNGLSVKDIGFVWRFLRPPGTGCVLSCRCGISRATTPFIRVAPTVATLRFHKVCAFVTISSNRPVFQAASGPRDCTAQHPLHSCSIRGSGARPGISQRIVKERPPCPYILSLRQDRPILSSKQIRAQRSWTGDT